MSKYSNASSSAVTGKMVYRHQILFVLMILVPLFLSAQNGIKVKATVDRNSILIGERITLTFEADIPETQQIRFFNIDTIDHFEFIDPGKIDTVNTSSGTMLRQEMIITSFDSGQWTIPSYVLDASHDIRTDSFIINVGFTPFDTSRPYNDIKDIIQVELEENKKNENWYWIAGGGLLFLTALLYILLRNRKKPVPVVQLKDPFDEAMDRLESLRNDKGLTPKEFYTILIDVFRTYLSKKKNISSMQRITDELVMQLQSLAIPHELKKELSIVLRTSDFVKFAKYQPSASDNNSALDTIRKSIMLIDKLPAA